ncbi:glutamate receptor 1, partial [Trichonephila clavata]
PEKLQVMFRVGYAALHLKLIGITRVKTASEAVEFLQNLDKPGSHRTFNVILDTKSSLARDILQLHVHHTGVRKKNYNFLLSEPTLEKFWTLHEFGALKITGFLALPPDYNRVKNEKEEWIKLLGNRSPNGDPDLSILDYYYHDAALFLTKAVWALFHRNINIRPIPNLKPPQISNPSMTDCFQGNPDGRIALILKKMRVESGLTGKIQYSDTKASRINVNLTIVQSTPTGYQEFGTWTDTGSFGGIRRHNGLKPYKPGSLPQISENNILRITTIEVSSYFL